MQDAVSAVRDVDVDQDTRWQDLYDTITDSEQSCIRAKLGSELELALERAVTSMVRWGAETHLWDVAIFECFAPETAVDIFVALVTGGVAELSEEDEPCVRNLIAGVNVAELVAATLPDANPDSNAMVQSFSVGLLDCMVQKSLREPLEDESLVWHFQTGGQGADSPTPTFGVVYAPTVAYGMVYAGSDDNRVYALDAETGELLWSFKTQDVIRSSPTVTNGGVYVGSNDNHVYALDSETGALLWRYDTGDWVQYSPPVRDGIVYVAAMSEGDRRIHALDGASGDVLWVAETSYPFDDELAPAVEKGKVYAPSGSGELHVLDTSTGELLWSLDVGMGADSPPTVVGGVVYLTAVNTAYALDESTGELVWSYGTERYPARDFPAVVADGVYYFSPDDHIYALDAGTGEVLWSFRVDGMINTAPVAAEGLVYVGSESGRFYALDAAAGRTRMESGANDGGAEVASRGRRRPLCRVQRRSTEGFEGGNGRRDMATPERLLRRHTVLHCVRRSGVRGLPGRRRVRLHRSIRYNRIGLDCSPSRLRPRPSWHPRTPPALCPLS